MLLINWPTIWIYLGIMVCSTDFIWRWLADKLWFGLPHGIHFRYPIYRGRLSIWVAKLVVGTVNHWDIQWRGPVRDLVDAVNKGSPGNRRSGEFVPSNIGISYDISLKQSVQLLSKLFWKTTIGEHFSPSIWVPRQRKIWRLYCHIHWVATSMKESTR